MFGIPSHKFCIIAGCVTDDFPIQSSLKQGYALSPLLFNFALEFTIRKVQANQVGVKLNGTYQLLAKVDDVNLLRNDKDSIWKRT
jgi:hypothetical protein